MSEPDAWGILHDRVHREDEQGRPAWPVRHGEQMEHPETTEAIATAWEGAEGEWQQEALNAIEHVAMEREYLTTDHIWATGLLPPREPRAMGAAMRMAAREKWIEPTKQWTESAKRTCHNRPKRVWRSRLYTLV